MQRNPKKSNAQGTHNENLFRHRERTFSLKQRILSGERGSFASTQFQYIIKKIRLRKPHQIFSP